MSSPEPQVPLAVLRHEADLAVSAASFRVVADEIGISAMGLRAFILGEGKQRKSTLRKLNAWYARRAAARGSEGMDEARSALVVLAGFYPEAARARVVRGLIERMEREFGASGMQPPAWLARLAAELGGPAEE